MEPDTKGRDSLHGWNRVQMGTTFTVLQARRSEFTSCLLGCEGLDALRAELGHQVWNREWPVGMLAQSTCSQESCTPALQQPKP